VGSCAKMAEWIDVLFGVVTPGDPRNIVLEGVPISQWQEGFNAVSAKHCIRWGPYFPVARGVQCSLSQITLATVLFLSQKAMLLYLYVVDFTNNETKYFFQFAPLYNEMSL